MEPISVKEILQAVNGELLTGNENIVIKGATTNSRQINKDDLFVPIIGERVDGHKFIAQALNDGASVSFTSEHTKENVSQLTDKEDKAVILVDDTLKALQDIATYSRSRFDVPLVGITGSVGKTTTKEMIAAALESAKCVLKTQGNLNSQIGVSLMMLRFEKKHEAAVIEMGVSEIGEMSRLVNIAKPGFAVMTNIGMSHINQFKVKENTRKEKLNIINCMEPSFGTLFVNGDDELLAQIIEYKKGNARIDISDDTKKILDKIKVVSFGTSKECDFYARDINLIDEKSTFTMVHGDEIVPVTLNVAGKHNIINALAALAVSKQMGISYEDAVKGLRNYRPIAMRGTIISNGKFRIIDDTYNASPDSIKSGIDVLTGMSDVTRTYAVLADVLELGEVSYQCHYDVGKYVAQSKTDELVTIGNEAKAIAQAVNDANCGKVVHSFDSNEEAIAYLKENVCDNALLLVKGSRGMHTDEIVEALK